MSPKNLPVFNNLKAWFSSSVPRKMEDLWKKQGGKEVDSVKDANFIFSNDATCPDIVDVYESEEFIQGFLAVFHASYIDACLKEKSAHNVAAAQYILLPSEMEDDIQKLAFVHSTSKNHNAEKISTKEQNQSTTYNPSTSNPNTNTKKVQSATCEPRTSSENTNTNHHQERLSSEPSEPSQRRDPPNIVHAEDIAFRIDDMERIPHVRTFPRFEGDISDFVPGVNGCSLSLKA